MMPGWKAGAREDDHVKDQNREIYKRNNEKRFSGQEPAPLVRAGQPKLAVANQGFALDHAHDEKPPTEAKGHTDKSEKQARDPRRPERRFRTPEYRRLPGEVQK